MLAYNRTLAVTTGEKARGHIFLMSLQVNSQRDGVFSRALAGMPVGHIITISPRKTRKAVLFGQAPGPKIGRQQQRPKSAFTVGISWPSPRYLT